MKILLLWFTLAWLLTGSYTAVSAAPAISEQQLAAQVVAEINAYRQANGFSALPTNGLLASLAQSHSEYQASIESVTHTGLGGSRPKDRATAAGYGGGGTFFMSEIIYGGYNATPAAAINWWKNSAVHNSVLLDSRYTELGAGVAYSEDRIYFTVELAWTGSYISYDGVGGDSMGNVGTLPGGTGSTSNSEPEGDTGTSTSSQPTSAPAAYPVSRAEPNEDGSIVHIVQAGQSLWTIAAVYGVELQAIYDLNQMNSSTLIFPGDEIIIQPPAGMVGPTEEPTPEPTPTETPSTAESPTPEEPENQELIGEAFSYAPPETPTPEYIPVLAEQVMQAEETSPQPSTTLDIPHWLIIAGAAILVLVIVSSSLFRRKPGGENNESPG